MAPTSAFWVTMTDQDLPPIMKNAREDLLATVSGRFAPEDWERILSLAKNRLAAGETWPAVILDFHRAGYWGFTPNYRPPRAQPAPKQKVRPNYGIRFAVLVVTSMTVTKIAVVWLGQVYSRSDERRDAYAFYIVIALVIANFGYFLWKNRAWTDE